MFRAKQRFQDKAQSAGNGESLPRTAAQDWNCCLALCERARVNTGFTLLEVLIALVLLSFILMILYGSLYTSARSWRDSEIRSQQTDDKRLVLSFIRRQLGEAMPMLQVGEQERRVMFQGENSSLQFVSSLPAHHAGSGLYFLKFVVHQDALWLKYTTLARDKAMFEEDIFVEAEAISLLEDIEAIDLDYFGRDNVDAEPAWHDEWDNKERLPELIRFKIIASEPDSWLPLVIAVRCQAAREQPPLTLHMKST